MPCSVHTFPRTDTAGEQLTSLSRPFFVHTIDAATGVVAGYRLAFDRDHTGVAERMWRVEFDAEREHIAAVARPDNGRVASMVRRIHGGGGGGGGGGAFCLPLDLCEKIDEIDWAFSWFFFFLFLFPFVWHRAKSLLTRRCCTST